MTENQACGLEGAEAAAVNNGTLMPVLLRHQRQDFIENIFLESIVPANALGRMAIGAVEGLSCQSLDAVELKLSGIQLIREAGDDADLLIFPEATGAGGKYQYFCAGMAEHQQLHVAMQPRTVPAQVFAVHSTLKNCPTFFRRIAFCCSLPA